MEELDGVEEAHRKLREFGTQLKDPSVIESLVKGAPDQAPMDLSYFAGEGATPSEGIEPPPPKNFIDTSSSPAAGGVQPLSASKPEVPPKYPGAVGGPYQAKDSELEFLQDRAGKRRQSALLGQAGDTIASAFQSKGARGDGGEFWKNFAAEGDRKIGDLKMRRNAEEAAAKSDPNSPVSQMSRDFLASRFPDLAEKMTGKSAADLENVPVLKQILESENVATKAKVAADIQAQRAEAAAAAKAAELAAEAEGLKSSLPALYGPQLKTLGIDLNSIATMGPTELKATLEAAKRQKGAEEGLERAKTSSNIGESKAIRAEGRAEERKSTDEQRKSDAKQNVQTQEIRGFYTTMKKDLAELRNLVNQKGTFEALGSHNKQLEQRLDDIAVTMAKFVDPNSVARESEVAGFRKQLFSPSLTMKNKTAQEVMDSFERIIEDRLKTAYEVRGIQPPDVNNPNAGIAPKATAGGAVQMKFPDGSVHQVTSDKIDAAKKKGGQVL
jgi:hypothetical protein